MLLSYFFIAGTFCISAKFMCTNVRMFYISKIYY